MKKVGQLLIGFALVVTFSSATQASPFAQRATFTAPYAHASYASQYEYPDYQQPFRWGHFGAGYHPPAPVMNRDYNRGWREWHYRR